MSATDKTLMKERPVTVASGRGLGAPVLRTVLSFIDWAERARERRSLMELDDRLLKDIGLTRSDVERECSKPFWRP